MRKVLNGPLVRVAHFLTCYCIPPGIWGNILITSRNEMLLRATSHNSLAVDEMEEEEAVSLLLKSGNLDPSTARDDAKMIVNALGCVPLAIDQAGAYIHTCQCSPDHYLKLYKLHCRKLLLVGWVAALHGMSEFKTICFIIDRLDINSYTQEWCCLWCGQSLSRFDAGP